MRATTSQFAALRERTAAVALLFLAVAPHARAQGDTEVLSNGTIVQMVAGKLSRDLITGKINSARPGFDLSSDGLISLTGSKVDQKIITLMLQVADNARRSGTAPADLKGMDEVLTNEIVVRMLTSKVPRQVILSKIQMSQSTFDVTSGGLVSLSSSKVPEEVIKAMMVPPPPPVKAQPLREAPAAAGAATSSKTEAKKDTKAPTKAATSSKSKAPAKDTTQKATPAKKP